MRIVIIAAFIATTMPAFAAPPKPVAVKMPTVPTPKLYTPHIAAVRLGRSAPVSATPKVNPIKLQPRSK